MADRASRIKLENSIGSVINPATEETLQSIAGFAIPAYDYIAVAYPNSTTETYTYKSGGSGGTTLATITIVYSDSTKANITSVAKS